MLVGHSRAVDPGSAWAAAAPMQQVANTASLALCSALVLVHALAAFIYGWFHFFILEGFLEVTGLPAWLLAFGNLALGAAWGSHVWQRHFALATREGSHRFRRNAYRAWGALWLLGLSLWWILPEGGLRPVAIAPHSELPFFPLRWIWERLVPLASNRASMRLIIAGSIAAVVALGCAKLGWGRGMLLGAAVLLAVAGAFFLGMAGFQFAASRELAAIGPDVLADYQADPGRFNAWVAVSWWTGVAALAWSAITLFTALRAPRAALARAVEHARD